jgi:AraC-like DNA-binding protein
MTSLEELLLAEPNRAWSVAELSSKLGMSDRLLRQSCQACVGMSPQSFVRLQRLHSVHRALRHPASSSTSVSEVGHQHGFRHLSRLAVDYRTLFGELPSHTLLQCRYGELPPLSASRPTFDRSLAQDTHTSGSARASVEKLEPCLLMSQSSRLDR